MSAQTPTPTPTEWIRPRRWLTVLFIVGGAAIAVMGTFRFPDRWADPYDWRYFESTEEVHRRTVVDYGQVPLWNPYMCGGEVALANPQSTVAAPTFLFSLFFGTALGLKLALLVYFLCAFHGAYLLARELRASWAGALVAAAGFGTCGWFVLHLSSGHINFAGAALYPYLLFFYRRSLDRHFTWALPAGGVVAWMLGLGGTYTAPMGAIMLAILAFSDAIERRSFKPILLGAGIGGFALLAGAWRMFPVLEFVGDHPRHVKENDAVEIIDVLRSFFAWRQTLAPVRGHVYWWHEYCCHLPYLVSALALLGALDKSRRRDLLPLAPMVIWSIVRFALPQLDARMSRYYGYRDAFYIAWSVAAWIALRRSRGRALAPLFILSLGIAAGRAWPYGPWFLLRKLPLYHDLRVPSRYLILTAIPIVVWAAHGLDVAISWLRDRRPPLRASMIAAAAVLVTLAEGLLFAAPAFFNIFVVYQNPSSDRGAFHQIEGDRRWMFTAILDNRGVWQCDEEAPLQRAEGLDLGPGDQVRLADPSAGSVKQDRWTPNEIVLSTDLSKTTDILINQNWNEHWRTDAGQVVKVAGRLAVRLDPGRRTLTLRYRPRSFVAGAWVSILSIAAAVAAWLITRRRRQP